MSDENQETPEIGAMPDFDPVVSSKQFDELSRLPEDQRRMVLPIVRALSISDQRAAFHFNYTKIHNSSIRRIERQKNNWRSRINNSVLWIITTIVGAIALAWAAKVIHP